MVCLSYRIKCQLRFSTCTQLTLMFCSEPYLAEELWGGGHRRCCWWLSTTGQLGEEATNATATTTAICHHHRLLSPFAAVVCCLLLQPSSATTIHNQSKSSQEKPCTRYGFGLPLGWTAGLNTCTAAHCPHLAGQHCLMHAQNKTFKGKAWRPVPLLLIGWWSN